MDTDAILHALTHAPGLPREAIQAANQRQTHLIPLLCAEFDRVQRGGRLEWNRPNCLFFAFHLLGSWKALPAYRTLARFLQGPSAMVDSALGGAVTETPHRVMAAVFDSDPVPLFDIILDFNADEFIRARMCEVLAMIVADGRLPRALAHDFLHDAFLAIRPKAPCFVWTGWQQSIALLELHDLVPLVRQAFDRGFIGTDICSFEDFEEDLHLGGCGLTHKSGKETKEYTLFGDTVSELSTWHCFSDAYVKDLKDRERREQDHVLATPAPEPIPLSNRELGRNDPCPCGSGKKYKKCCLVQASASSAIEVHPK